jgi:hypothetical protein
MVWQAHQQCERSPRPRRVTHSARLAACPAVILHVSPPAAQGIYKVAFHVLFTPEKPQHSECLIEVEPSDLMCSSMMCGADPDQQVIVGPAGPWAASLKQAINAHWVSRESISCM